MKGVNKIQRLFPIF